MNMFEIATRYALRFETVKGFVTVEDLWTIPLTSKTGFDLDTIAKELNKAIKQMSEEESFVTKSDTRSESDLYETKFKIVKYIIDVKLADKEVRELATKRKAERQVLIDILNRKESQALEDLSADEIRKRLAELE